MSLSVPRVSRPMLGCTGALILAASLANVSSAYEATGSVVADVPVANPDVGDQSDLSGFSWSLGTAAPPSLVKCLCATLAGSIFAVLGMVVESIRNRKAQKTLSHEEIGKLLPKRPPGVNEIVRGSGRESKSNGDANKGSDAAGAADQQAPATKSSSSRPSIFGKSLSEVEQAERQVKSLLNKLTRDKFDSLYGQLKETCISSFPGVKDRQEIVDVVAKEAFQKATKQHNFIEMYADLCAKLDADLENAGIQVHFKRGLLEQCQHSFKVYMEPPRIDKSLDYEEQYEALVKYKTQMLGNIMLVGHLLIRRMLSPKVIFHCTDELLSIGSDEALETLVVFVDTIGKTFDSPEWKWQPKFQEVFTRMELLAESPHQSSRLKCLIKDVLDKKRNRWREPVAPKVKLPSQPAGPRPVSEADASPCWRAAPSPTSDAGMTHAKTSPASNGMMRQASGADASPSWRNAPTPTGTATSSPMGSPSGMTHRAKGQQGGKGCFARSPVADLGKSANGLPPKLSLDES